MDKDGYCTVCPGKCSYKDHTNAKYYYKLVKIEYESHIDHLKANFDSAKGDLSNVQVLLKSYVDELIKTVDDLEEAHKKIKECDEFL